MSIITDLDHPCIAQWLKQHGKLISHLTLNVDVSEERLKLRDLCEAATSCTSIDLAIRRSSSQVDLADLRAVAGSLHCFTCGSLFMGHGSLRGASAFHNMSQLVALELNMQKFDNEEPWGMLAKLTNLQQLSLTVYASGDPSPLSALTRLSSLAILSLGLEADEPAPFSFSSLQPLSTLQQLERLHLGIHACAATSLQGLAGLSNLQQLGLGSAVRRLRSLEGISRGLIRFYIMDAPDLVNLAGIEVCTSLENLSLSNVNASSLQPLKGLSSLKELSLYADKLTSLEDLSGISLQSLSLTWCSSLTNLSGFEHLSALKSLEVKGCGVTSLQLLSQLGEGLQKLRVVGCRRVQEEVLELPHVQPTADVVVECSSVKEVVLAGGERRAVGSSEPA
jgi:hypothetical protein